MSLKKMVEELKDSTDPDKTGAIVIFTGLVKGKNRGDVVKKLEFEEYMEVTEKFIEELEKELEKREGVQGVKIRHKTGEIEVGEEIVNIAVASTHRKEGFETCEECIDRFKKEIPIWKKEITEKGSRWIHDL